MLLFGRKMSQRTPHIPCQFQPFKGFLQRFSRSISMQALLQRTAVQVHPALIALPLFHAIALRKDLIDFKRNFDWLHFAM